MKLKKLLRFISLERRFSINVISLFSINLLNFVISLISLPFLFKNYGAELWGQIVIIQIILNYLVWIIDWSFNQYSSKLIAISEGDLKNQRNIFYITLSSQSILFLFSNFILISITIIFNKFSNLFYFANLILIGHILQPYWFLNGKEKIYQSALYQLLKKLLFVLLILVFINEDSNLNDYFFFLAISSIITGIIMFAKISKEYKFKIFELINYIKNINIGFKFIKKSSRLFFSEIISTFNDSIYPVLISSQLGNIELGIYNLSDRIKTIFIQVLHPIGHSLFPRMSQKYNLSKLKANKSFTKVILFYLILSIMIFLFANFFIEQIISFFSDSYVSKLENLLRILLFSFVLNGLSEQFITQYFIPNNMFEFLNNIQLKKTFISFIILIPLISSFGINGAALANLLSESIMLGFLIKHFINTKNNSPNIQT